MSNPELSDQICQLTVFERDRQEAMIARATIINQSWSRHPP